MPKKPKATLGKTWPASDVKTFEIKNIKPYPNNPRTHDAEQIKMLARLMERYGVDQPIVVDEKGIIIKGHGRRLAALEAGFSTFPVVVHRGLSEEDKKAIRIADNQSALLSGWDEELMRLELGGLQQSGFDMDLLGFDEEELSGFLVDEEPQPADPDEIPEPVKLPVVRHGDLWNLGDHRILCGTSVNPATWQSMMRPTERAAMVFTDPPYGVSYQSDKYEVIKGDKKRRDDLYKMLVNSFRWMVHWSTDEAAFYIWHASVTRDDFADAIKAAGLIERQYLIWVKPGIAFGRADYQWQHEPCFYAGKGERKPAFYGDRTQSTVWHVQIGGRQSDVAATVGNGVVLLDGKGGTLFIQSKVPKNKKLRQIRLAEEQSVHLSGSDRQEGTVWEVSRDTGTIHPTQKPVELARRAIENSSQEGEIVLDGFLGSGTTLIGAEITGRRCIGTELDPVYAEQIIERWEKLTGKKALRQDGKTLETLRYEAGNSGESVRGQDRHGAQAQRAVPEGGDARQSAEG